MPRQASSAVAIGLCLAGIGFKVAYTKADAPELLNGLDRTLLALMRESSLVTQARTMFLGTAFSMAFVIFKRFDRRSALGKSTGA